MSGLRRVLATDIDGTLIGHGGEEHLVAFFEHHPDLAVIYLTGRTRHNAETVLRRFGFPAPLAVATEVGAEIYWGRHMVMDDIWAFQQRQEWSPRRIRHLLEAIDAVRYRGRSSHWRLAFDVHEPGVLKEVRRLLAREQVAVHLLWEEADHRLDVLPAKAHKGLALNYILNRAGIRSRACFVAGNGENDRDLMQGHFPGVIVANACHRLKSSTSDTIWQSSRPGAYGVIEGLTRWCNGEPRKPAMVGPEEAGLA